MALIKCEECGKEHSDTVENCIHCGYKRNQKEEPKVEAIKENKQIKKEIDPNKYKIKYEKENRPFLWVLPFLLYIGWVLLVGTLGGEGVSLAILIIGSYILYPKRWNSENKSGFSKTMVYILFYSNLMLFGGSLIVKALN